MIPTREGVWSDIEKTYAIAWSDAKREIDRKKAEGEIAGESLARTTSYGVFMKPRDKQVLSSWLRDIDIDWFDEKAIEYQGALFLPAKHNLAVDTGLEISARLTFTTGSIPGGGVAMVGGGVDNNVTAVAAGTTQFDTTAGNRFLTGTGTTVNSGFTVTPTYASKVVTANFQITNSNTTIVHRRYGLHNAQANTNNCLFSMLSGFILDFNGKTYDITVQTQTTWSGT